MIFDFLTVLLSACPEASAALGLELGTSPLRAYTRAIHRLVGLDSWARRSRLHCPYL